MSGASRFRRVGALKCSGSQSTSRHVKPGASWLCPTPNHRERFLDMQERLRTARVVTLAALSATAVVVRRHRRLAVLVAAAVAVIAVAIGGVRPRTPAPARAVGLRLDRPRPAARARLRGGGQRWPAQPRAQPARHPGPHGRRPLQQSRTGRGRAGQRRARARRDARRRSRLRPGHPDRCRSPGARHCSRSTSARWSPPTSATAPTARSTSSPGCSTAARWGRASPRSPSRRR